MFSMSQRNKIIFLQARRDFGVRDAPASKHLDHDIEQRSEYDTAGKHLSLLECVMRVVSFSCVALGVSL